MAEHGASPSEKKKLYIETVGCQMNLLDSELVVAKLRSEGYELTDDIQQADAILYNTCSVRQHAEDKIYSALGRIKRIKERKPERDHRRAGLHGPEGPGADLPAGAARGHRRGAGPARARARAARRREGGGQATQIAVSRARNDGSLEAVTASFETYDADREPAMRPQPVPGVRPGHDGLRQVLHLLHRALGPWPRAEPAARRDPGRGPAAGRPGGQGDHPPGPDGQQLSLSPRPTAGPGGSPTCWPRSTTSTASSGSSSSPTSPTT